MKDNLDFNVEFIREVEKNPSLYDNTLAEYTNKKNSKIIWSKIAQKFDEEAHELKAKWKSIRSAYIRNMSPKPRSGSSAPCKNEYYLAPYLKFLNPFLKIRLQEDAVKNQEEDPIPEETVFIKQDDLTEPEAYIDASSNTDNESVVHDAYITSSSSSNPLQSEPKRQLSEVETSAIEYFTAKRRRLEDEERVAGERDPCELFLRSLAPHMRSMSQQDQLRFQRGVLELIENIKF